MITALPLQPGRLNLSTGTFTNVTIVHCQEDGDITLKWFNGEPDETYSMLSGEDVFVYEAETVTIVTGIFAISSST